MKLGVEKKVLVGAEITKDERARMKKHLDNHRARTGEKLSVSSYIRGLILRDLAKGKGEK